MRDRVAPPDLRNRETAEVIGANKPIDLIEAEKLGPLLVYKMGISSPWLDLAIWKESLQSSHLLVAQSE